MTPGLSPQTYIYIDMYIFTLLCTKSATLAHLLQRCNIFLSYSFGNMTRPESNKISIVAFGSEFGYGFRGRGVWIIKHISYISLCPMRCPTRSGRPQKCTWPMSLIYDKFGLEAGRVFHSA